MDIKEIEQKTLNLVRDMNDSKTFSHSDIIDYTDIFLKMVCKQNSFALETEEFELAKKNIVEKYEMIIGVTQPLPIFISSTNPGEWFDENSKNNDFKYFERYKRFLRNDGFPDKTIENIEDSTKKILSYCADPNGSILLSEKKKRGLVVGDVQSGKTSNYISLINMACDMGYKIIVLLAGLTSSLRRQTQDRIDEGFIGAKSDTLSESPEFIGVGMETDRYYGIPLTNHTNDFKKFVMKNQNSAADDYNKPVVLVVKKNKSVLEYVSKWLNPKQRDNQTNNIIKHITSNNILIIDDEADNASINTKKNPDEISAINGAIREIYNGFDIASYVGYTATPFANIFIDPFEENPSNQDLFPSDFIVLLETPDNYFGFEKTFKINNNGNYEHINIIDETDSNYFPTKHKKTDQFPGLSSDLKDAIYHFYLVNVIRTLRGDTTKHRSMLINITRFNIIQKDIVKVVDKFNKDFLNLLSELNNADEERFVSHKYLKRLKYLYLNDKNYSKARDEFTWSQIREKLLDEVKLVEVVLMNNSVKSVERFSYDDHKEVGARVIVVGGLVLSRGITLEGLVVSYFNRNSTAYDTLLQMCRWFGYRFKYDDIIKIYMTQENVDCFEAVNEAVESLKNQFRQMHLENKTPKDFGFAVKQSPDTLETTLLVTARNKMNHTKEINLTLNYSGHAVDTSKIYCSYEKNLDNYNAIRNMFFDLIHDGKTIDFTNKPLIKDVEKEYIIKLLKNIKIPNENTKFDRMSIINFLVNEDKLNLWDVVIATGDGIKISLDWLQNDISTVERSFVYNDNESYYRISGNKNRLYEPSIFATGLKQEEIDFVKLNKEHKSGPIASEYLNVPERKPLLIIYPLRLKNTDSILEKYEESLCNDALWGFAIGFPGVKDGLNLTYRVNLIKLEQMELEQLEDEYDEEDDGENVEY